MLVHQAPSDPSVYSLWMITDGIGLLEDIKLDRCFRSIRIQCKQKRLLRLNVGSLSIRLCPCDVRESSTDLSTVVQGNHKQRSYAIANIVEARGRESMTGRPIDQLPVLLWHSEPIVQNGLQVHLVVLQDLGSREHIDQKTRL